MKEEPKAEEVKTRKDMIEEYLDKNLDSQTKANKIIFENKNMLQKTELSDNNINVLKLMTTTRDVLKRNGLFDMYTEVIDNFANLMVSRDRKGRTEFVKINSQSDLVDEVKKSNEVNKMLGK